MRIALLTFAFSLPRDNQKTGNGVFAGKINFKGRSFDVATVQNDALADISADVTVNCFE